MNSSCIFLKKKVSQLFLFFNLASTFFFDCAGSWLSSLAMDIKSYSAEDEEIRGILLQVSLV